jgi:Na+-transporting methylmalonyl-CoA/oxaloacetate decarboxylase gamma subunit
MIATPALLVLMLVQNAELDGYLDRVAAAEQEALFLAVVGIGVVFTALVLIGVCISALGRLLSPSEVVPPVQVISSAHGMPLRTEDHERLVILITAAATAAIGRPVRVRRITFINRNTISAWAERGRVSIQSSHNTGRRL